jgi:glutamate-5-semialdehyde dehydrogenase
MIMALSKLFESVREASTSLSELDDKRINEILLAVADEAVAQTSAILEANAKDLARMDPANPMYDRLKLTKERIDGIASDTRHVAQLPSPLGRVLKHSVLPNGLDITRVSVPFGVIGIVYEARPNVTFDVFSLCLKSGNACILKGGKDADDSNRAIMNVIHTVLKRFGVSEMVAQLLPATHEATAELLEAVDYVDLIIPRGSSRLIQFVRDTAKVPVIETGAGICHAYFDEFGDLEKGKAIINNA